MTLPNPVSLDDLKDYYLQIAPNSVDTPKLKFSFNNTNGRLTVYKNANIGNSDIPIDSVFWKSPSDNTVYYIRFQSATAAATGTTNTWLATNAVREVEWNTSAANTVDGSVTISIATDNLGSTVLATKEVKFYVSKQTPTQSTNLSALDSKYVVSDRRGITVSVSGNGAISVNSVPFTGSSTTLTTGTWKAGGDTDKYYVRFTGDGDSKYVTNSSVLNKWHLLSASPVSSAEVKFENVTASVTNPGKTPRRPGQMKLKIEIAKGQPNQRNIVTSKNVTLGLTYPAVTSTGNTAVSLSNVQTSYSANNSVHNPSITFVLDENGTWKLQGKDDTWSPTGSYGAEHGATIDSGTWYSGNTSESLIKFYMKLKSDLPESINGKHVVKRAHYTEGSTYHVGDGFESYDWVPIYIGAGRHYELTVENPFKKTVGGTANIMTGNIHIGLATDQFGINVLDSQVINFSLTNNTVFTPGSEEYINEMKKIYTQLQTNTVPGLKFGIMQTGVWTVSAFDETANSYVLLDNGKWRSEDDMEDYYVRFTSNVGTTSGTLNTWLPLTSVNFAERNHYVEWKDTTNNSLGLGGTLTIDISHNGSNAGIIATKNISFAVNKGPYPVTLDDLAETYNTDVSNTTLKIQINSDGTWTVYDANPSDGSDRQVGTGRWRNVSDNATYYVRFDSNTVPTEGTRDVWQATNTTRTIKWVDSTPSGSSTNGAVTIYLASDANGANIVSKKYVYFSLNNTTNPVPNLDEIQNVYTVTTSDPEGLIIQFHKDGTWDIITNEGEVIDSGRWCEPGDESVYYIKFDSSTVINHNLGILNSFMNLRSHGE